MNAIGHKKDWREKKNVFNESCLHHQEHFVGKKRIELEFQQKKLD